MILNLVILAFILGMAYWWALQGFFSAFLHLIIVIVAGAVAFGLWEPLVFNFGMKMQPLFAWGLWLLGPFVLVLIVLRVASDRLVRKNVQFPNLVNNILGGVCGAIAGVLTAGIAVLGLGFLPLPPALAGHQPYMVANGGQVTDNDSLWLPVDSLAAGVYSTLSRSAFDTSTPMATHQPKLADQAALFRMTYQSGGSSVVAIPGSVSVNGLYSQPAPVKELDPKVAIPLGPDAQNPSNKIVVVDTRWTQAPGTYDTDGALRLPPTQIRLVAISKDVTGDKLSLHAPVAFSRADGDARTFTAFTAADVAAFGNFPTEQIAWAFILPAEADPSFLLARHTRLPLPEANQDVAQLASALGTPSAPKEGDAQAAAQPGATGPSNVGVRDGIRVGHVADAVDLTSALPKPISTNFATGLTRNGTSIVEGSTVAGKPPAALSQNTRIDSIYVPDHQGGVRIKLSQDVAQSLLGAARVAAASLQGVWLTDSRGEKYLPLGYVWEKSNGDMEIKVDRNAPIQSARQLPITQMSTGEGLFLYFAIPKGRQIVSYNIGDTTKQDLTPPLDVK